MPPGPERDPRPLRRRQRSGARSRPSWGQPLSALFASVDPACLAAASIAQVRPRKAFPWRARWQGNRQTDAGRQETAPSVVVCVRVLRREGLQKRAFKWRFTSLVRLMSSSPWLGLSAHSLYLMLQEHTRPRRCTGPCCRAGLRWCSRCSTPAWGSSWTRTSATSLPWCGVRQRLHLAPASSVRPTFVIGQARCLKNSKLRPSLALLLVTCGLTVRA